MHILLAIGVTILTAGAAAQAPALAPTPPITITFVNTVTVDDGLSFFSKMSGVTIEIDQSVTEDIRKQPFFETSPVTMREVTLEQVLETLTTQKGLSFTIVNSRMVRIFKKA